MLLCQCLLVSFRLHRNDANVQWVCAVIPPERHLQHFRHEIPVSFRWFDKIVAHNRRTNNLAISTLSVNLHRISNHEENLQITHWYYLRISAKHDQMGLKLSVIGKSFRSLDGRWHWITYVLNFASHVKNHSSSEINYFGSNLLSCKYDLELS